MQAVTVWAEINGDEPITGEGSSAAHYARGVANLHRGTGDSLENSRLRFAQQLVAALPLWQEWRQAEAEPAQVLDWVAADLSYYPIRPLLIVLAEKVSHQAKKIVHHKGLVCIDD